MVKIAVAGGTASVGRHIVEEILATKKHEVVVLSRAATHPELQGLGAQITAVDYADSASLVAALRGVHTVISALSIVQGPAPQLALLDAAIKAGVTRFAPSEWAARSIPNNPVEWYRSKWDVAQAVRQSGLEYTIFENGVFMNYLAIGTAGIGHLREEKLLFDPKNCKAQILGDGSTCMVFTRAEDVGKFVAASLDWEKWPEYSQMRGERLEMNKVVELLEAVRGKSFDVTYIPQQTLEDTVAKEAECSLTKFYAQVSLEMLTNPQYAYTTANLNDAFPEVQPMKVEEFLKKWWATS